MIPARITLGDGPTSQINPIITSVEAKFAIGRRTKRRSTRLTMLTKTEIVNPEWAKIYIVPEFVNEFFTDTSNVVLTPNNIPLRSPACGSGNRPLISAVSEFKTI
jgi:hypothetical protein